MNLEYWNSDLFEGIKDSLEHNCDGRNWIPHFNDLFKPFVLCPLRHTKVILLGDGLISGPHKADGLAFSYFGVSPGSEKAASTTRAIHNELKRDLDFRGTPNTGNLAAWARRGVLLLNTSLTGDENTNYEHDSFWNDLISEVIVEATDVNPEIAFILIGDKAQELAGGLSIQGNYFTVETYHPRIDAYGGQNFCGSSCFSKTNKYLKSVKRSTIDWSLPGCNRY